MASLRLKINIVTFRLLQLPQTHSQQYFLLTKNSQKTNSFSLCFKYGLLDHHLTLQHHLSPNLNSQNLQLVLVEPKDCDQEICRASLALSKINTIGLQSIKMLKGSKVVAKLEIFMLLLQSSLPQPQYPCHFMAGTDNYKRDKNKDSVSSKTHYVNATVQTQEIPDQMWEKSLLDYAEKIKQENFILLQQIESFDDQKLKLAFKIQNLERKISIIGMRLQRQEQTEVFKREEKVSQLQQWLLRKSELCLISFDESWKRWNHKEKSLSSQFSLAQPASGYLFEKGNKQLVLGDISPLSGRQPGSLNRCLSKWSSVQTVSSLEQYL